MPLAPPRNSTYYTKPWLWDLALELRVPALFFLGTAVYNSKLYSEANAAWAGNPNAKVGVTRGKLLELNRFFYQHMGVPRYTVKYEFTVDGKTYVSTRATTASPYRNWMEGWYNDTITESQYLQSIPPLRVGEPCTVFYSKRWPDAHSALAHDGNSFEMSFLVFAGVFPLVFGTQLKSQFFSWRRNFFRRKIKVKYPAWAFPGRSVATATAEGATSAVVEGSAASSSTVNAAGAAAAGAAASEAAAGAASSTTSSSASRGEAAQQQPPQK